MKEFDDEYSEPVEIYPGNALALLEVMKPVNNWNDAQMQRYVMVLDQLDPQLGFAAVARLSMDEWRPSPRAILQTAARLALMLAAQTSEPFPSAEAAYAEIITLAQELGTCARKVPGRNVYLDGPPRFSHPLIAQIVAHVGGWRFVCNGESNKSEGLSKQVRTLHESLSAKWIDEVCESLLRTESERPRRLFPSWKPFRVMDGWTEEPEEEFRAIPAAQVRTPEFKEFAPKVRQLLQAGFKSIGQEKHKAIAARVFPPVQDRPEGGVAKGYQALIKEFGLDRVLSLLTQYRKHAGPAANTEEGAEWIKNKLQNP